MKAEALKSKQGFEPPPVLKSNLTAIPLRRGYGPVVKRLNAIISINLQNTKHNYILKGARQNWELIRELPFLFNIIKKLI